MSEIPELTSVLSISPGYRLQWENAQGCHVLLYPEGMVQLNETAALILQQFDGVKTLTEIIADLKKEYTDSPDQENELRSDVVEFVSEAIEQGWLHVS